jgi:acyl-coenzyme A synthetase/AMP-(fatty) acid ligase
MLSPFAIPLTAQTALDRPAVIGGGRKWRWRDVHAAAVVLAEQLASDEAVVNLCASRVGFLVTWLAALRRGCMQLLPPSGGHADLVALLTSVARPTIVVDAAQLLESQWVEHARCIVHVPAAVGAAAQDLAWQPDWDAPRLRLYTSGSTGRPEPQTKTLAQLLRGAQQLASQLDRHLVGGVAELRAIVCSVPAQHMYGLETSVMLPLACGMAVLDARPLLPADVHAALLACGDGGAAWVATPLHLRAMARSGDALPGCRLVVASTMPLAAPVAVDVEARAGAPVLEIYGSTETGAIALRRPAQDSAWQPLDGVRLEPYAEHTLAWGPHFASPQTLADRIAFEPSGRFQLLGRRGDLIKVAGRRASLAGLNLLLQDLPGLDDGAFYQPNGAADSERLVLFHAGSPLDRPAIEAWLRERIDPAFVPRTLIRVERLPRSDNGKLPRAALDALYTAWRAERGDR